MADAALITNLLSYEKGSNVIESLGFWGWAADKVAPTLITGVTIALLASWLLARLNEAAKGRREHLVKTVDRLLDSLDELQRDASEYYAKSGQDSQLESSIEYALQLISALIDVTTKEMFSDYADIEDLFIRLAAEAVTDQFGLITRAAETDRGRLVAGMCADLATKIIEARGVVVRDSVRASFGRWVGTPVGTLYIPN